MDTFWYFLGYEQNIPPPPPPPPVEPPTPLTFPTFSLKKSGKSTSRQMLRDELIQVIVDKASVRDVSKYDNLGTTCRPFDTSPFLAEMNAKIQSRRKYIRVHEVPECQSRRRYMDILDDPLDREDSMDQRDLVDQLPYDQFPEIEVSP